MPHLVENERIKLIAGFFDRGATLCLAVGVFQPVYALYSGPRVPPEVMSALRPDLWYHFAEPAPVWQGAISWALAGLALHAYAQLLLGSLRE